MIESTKTPISSGVIVGVAVIGDPDMNFEPDNTESQSQSKAFVSSRAFVQLKAFAKTPELSLFESLCPSTAVLTDALHFDAPR
jgi:hypothetical protein